MYQKCVRAIAEFACAYQCVTQIAVRIYIVLPHASILQFIQQKLRLKVASFIYILPSHIDRPNVELAIKIDMHATEQTNGKTKHWRIRVTK